MLLYILAFALAFYSSAASLALIVILALIFVLPEPEGPEARVAPGGPLSEAEPKGLKTIDYLILAR
jgi:hypothetical protein